MELNTYIDRLREQLGVAAAAGGEEALSLAQRLTAPLDSAVRLMLLDVLSAAAAEITRELAPGSVEVRLRGSEPEFVVTAVPAELAASIREDRFDGPDAVGSRSAGMPAAGEGGVARINLRLPDQLKSQVEQAAEREGLSINAWLVRAVAAAVDRGQSGPGREQRGPRSGQRYTGWGR
jgi:HicB family